MEGHVSDFWAQALEERTNYPSFQEMLLMRRGFTYLLADQPAVEEMAAQLEYARAAYFVATRSLPPEAIAKLEEPALGCPRSFHFDGRELSANCLVNAITVYNVTEALRRADLLERPLRVLEIGAGFGQAARLLLERLDIALYAICDLPENLFLSAFYLQALFPDRAATFVQGAGENPAGGFVFLVPPLVDRLAGPFDLILNSYSFQEMRRESVDQYLAVAARTLAPHGILYSLNSHGKDEILWPSEYLPDGFRLDRLRSPRKFPFQLTATVPYELVIRPGRREDTRTSAFFADGLDGIGCAFQLGLDEELEELCEHFVHGSLVVGEEAWLRSLGALFRAPGLEEKRIQACELRATGVLPHVSAYLEGCLVYAAGEVDEASRLLAEAAAGLGSSLARLHAVAMLGTLAVDEARHLEAQRVAAELAPHLAAGVVQMGWNQVGYRDHMRKCLRLATPTVPVRSRRRRIVRRIRSIRTPLS